MCEALPTFPIFHPTHGQALADDATWLDKQAHGWSKTDPAEKAEKAEPKKPAEKPAAAK